MAHFRDPIAGRNTRFWPSPPATLRRPLIFPYSRQFNAAVSPAQGPISRHWAVRDFPKIWGSCPAHANIRRPKIENNSAAPRSNYPILKSRDFSNLKFTGRCRTYITAKIPAEKSTSAIRNISIGFNMCELRYLYINCYVLKLHYQRTYINSYGRKWATFSAKKKRLRYRTNGRYR